MTRPATAIRVRPWIWKGRRMPDRSARDGARRLIIRAKNLIYRASDSRGAKLIIRSKRAYVVVRPAPDFAPQPRSCGSGVADGSPARPRTQRRRRDR